MRPFPAQLIERRRRWRLFPVDHLLNASGSPLQAIVLPHWIHTVSSSLSFFARAGADSRTKTLQRIVSEASTGISIMTTLYDLLGALPGDDAGALRSAFRQAVKGVHPDIRPGDPEAALNFRLIVHAMEVLGDPDQRAAYDHLLYQARQELVSQHRAAKLRNFAFAMIGLAGVSVAAVGAYILSAPMAALPLHVRQIIDLPAGWAGMTSTAPPAPPPLNDNNPTATRNADTTPPPDAKDDFLTRWDAHDIGTKTDRDTAATRADEVPPPPRPDADDSHASDTPQPPHANDNDAPADRAAASATVTKEQETPILRPDPNLPTRNNNPDDAAFQLAPHDKTDPGAVAQAKGIAAYRKGDLTLALAELSRAVALNPTFMLAYVNRGIVLYRLGKLDLALADVARARRIDRADRRKAAANVNRRRHGLSLPTESATLMLAKRQ
jgi:hypothetical protein